METTPRPFRVLNLFAFCALCFNWCAQAQPPDAPAKHDHSAAATDATPRLLDALRIVASGVLPGGGLWQYGDRVRLLL